MKSMYCNFGDVSLVVVEKISRGCQSVVKFPGGCINVGEKFPGVVKKSKHKFPRGQI